MKSKLLGAAFAVATVFIFSNVRHVRATTYIENASFDLTTGTSGPTGYFSAAQFVPAFLPATGDIIQSDITFQNGKALSLTHANQISFLYGPSGGASYSYSTTVTFLGVSGGAPGTFTVTGTNGGILNFAAPFLLSTFSFDEIQVSTTITAISGAFAETTLAFAIGGGDFQAAVIDAPNSTPLPAALPLFATGLGALGLLGWRRKKKATLAA